MRQLRFHFSAKQATKKAAKPSQRQSSLLSSHLINSIDKNSMKFENQHNSIWTFKEVNQHSQAFALGLVELGYKPGDKVGIMIERSFPSEVIACQLGCIKAGVTMVPMKPQSIDSVANAIQQSGIKGLLFSPYSKLDQNTNYEQMLRTVIPEMNTSPKGNELSSSQFKSLKHLIHTGFYSIDGTFKYKQMMFYGMRQSSAWKQLDSLQLDGKQGLFELNGKNITMNDFMSLQQKLVESQKIGDNDQIIIAGENYSPLSFAVGLANSLMNGKYIVYTGNSNLKMINKISNWFDSSKLFIEDQCLVNDQSHVFMSNQSKIKDVVVTSFNSSSKVDHSQLGDLKVKTVVSTNI